MATISNRISQLKDHNGNAKNIVACALKNPVTIEFTGNAGGYLTTDFSEDTTCNINVIYSLQAHQDSSGNVIENTYMKKSGGVFTGPVTFTSVLANSVAVYGSNDASEDCSIVGLVNNSGPYISIANGTKAWSIQFNQGGTAMAYGDVWFVNGQCEKAIKDSDGNRLQDSYCKLGNNQPVQFMNGGADGVYWQQGYQWDCSVGWNQGQYFVDGFIKFTPNMGGVDGHQVRWSAFGVTSGGNEILLSTDVAVLSSKNGTIYMPFKLWITPYGNYGTLRIRVVPEGASQGSTYSVNMNSHIQKLSAGSDSVHTWTHGPVS